MKNIGKYLLATTALFSLAACQTTGTSTDSLISGSAQGVSTTASESKIITTDVEITQNEDGGLTAMVDGKKYEFSKADMDANSERPLFKKDLTEGGSVRVGRHWAGASEHSELWQVQLKNKDAKTEQVSYVAIGEKTEKPPTTGTASYKGGMHTLLRDKAGGDAFKFVFSNLDLTVDFAKSTLSGQTKNSKLYSNEHEGLEFAGSIAVSNGKIDGNKITADLKSNAEFDTGAGLASNLTGTLSGNFFGYYGSEIKGNGVLSNDKMTGAFGFGADSH